MKRKCILVPRFLDATQLNAQNLNAKSMLSRFDDESIEWLATYYDDPDPAVQNNSHIRLVKLWRWHLWKLRMFLFYLQPADALFYPGGETIDAVGWRWRKRLYPYAPIIATLEGLAGTQEREELLSKLAGHPVYCQRVSQNAMERLDDRLHKADHVIAISPFLAKVGKELYGDKFSVLPLGVDQSLFYPGDERNEGRLRVVSAGRVEKHKRPELFLELANSNPNADFVWFGEGTCLLPLQARALEQGINNISFAGSLAADRLGDEFRNADLFVMPSKSEGVPKVTQEAAACGLPIVLFGYYEAPTVIDGQNGRVVWSDNALIEAVAELLSSQDALKEMRRSGLMMAREWSWDRVATRWLTKISNFISETR